MNRAPLVLLWGAPDEPPIAAVHRALLARGARVVLADQRRALATRMRHGTNGLTLTLAGQAVALAQVTGAYPRPYPSLPKLPDDQPARQVAQRHVARLSYELWQWAAATPAIVVNRPGPAE